MESSIPLICSACPRKCGATRNAQANGYCHIAWEPAIASICMHGGEEPVLVGSTGVCNVFFSHCNLQCIFCQNHQISLNSVKSYSKYSVHSACDYIAEELDKGAKIVGFVSPSHQVHAMMEIVNELKHRNLSPRVLYNSNGYDSVETLKALEDVVDIYLPDFKYSTNELGLRLSSAPNYFDAASLALKEMFRQKGTYLSLDDDGVAEIGMIIRHLVLPGFIQNSLDVLSHIAEELSPNIHISLMSQYSSPFTIPGIPDLNRLLTAEEYALIVSHFDRLGFHKGWIQELGSAQVYNPDFEKTHPFER